MPTAINVEQNDRYGNNVDLDGTTPGDGLSACLAVTIPDGLSTRH